MAEPYDKLIDSPIADMKNVGPREGGSITAAHFIQRFVENGVRWAHLDMAGKAWSDKASATYDKGATGFGVRLLDQYVADVLESAESATERAGRFLPARRHAAGAGHRRPCREGARRDGRLLVVAADEAASDAARPDAVGPGPGELPSAWPCRRRRRRASADPAVVEPRRPECRPQHADRRRRVARRGLGLRARFLPVRTASLEAARLAWKLLAGQGRGRAALLGADDGKWKQQA